MKSWLSMRESVSGSFTLTDGIMAMTRSLVTYSAAVLIVFAGTLPAHAQEEGQQAGAGQGGGHATAHHRSLCPGRARGQTRKSR